MMANFLKGYLSNILQYGMNMSTGLSLKTLCAGMEMNIKSLN